MADRTYTDVIPARDAGVRVCLRVIIAQCSPARVTNLVATWPTSSTSRIRPTSGTLCAELLRREQELPGSNRSNDTGLPCRRGFGTVLAASWPILDNP